MKAALRLMALAMLPIAVQAQQQPDIRDAFFAALKSPDGKYHGALEGDFAAFARQRLNTSSRIQIDISTVRVFRQQGCKRLHAVISAPDVRWHDQHTGAETTFEFGYEMNLCPDGSPPMEVALEPSSAASAAPGGPRRQPPLPAAR